MLEEDYIMKLIKELVRAVLKIVFGIDTESISSELISNEEVREEIVTLLKMIDEGKINEAENELHTNIDGIDNEGLKAALLFYDYLNNKDDNFLQENGFSRDEIKEGLKDIMAKYNLDSMSEMFLD